MNASVPKTLQMADFLKAVKRFFCPQDPKVSAPSESPPPSAASASTTAGYSPHGMRTSGSGSDINHWKICGPDPQTRRSEARANYLRATLMAHARAPAGYSGGNLSVQAPALLEAHEQMQLKAENAALRERLASFEASAPAFLQTAEWLRTELPKLIEADYWEPTKVEIPILALRFTHKNVNASLAFGDSHENHQENILKLFDQMFRGRVRPDEIEPLCVKLPPNLEDSAGIRSRNNRRLLALRQLQSCRLDTCIIVPCLVHSHSYYLWNHKFRKWFDNGDDQGAGWSICCREGKSRHRGVAAFNNAEATLTGLEKLRRRHPNENTTSLEEFCQKLRKRRVGRDWEEETLTLAGSYQDEAWASTSQPPFKKQRR